MGTRGGFGFIYDGVYKINYVQFDSYPSGLGQDIVNWIKSVIKLNKKYQDKNFIEILKERVNDLKLVNENDKVPLKLQERYRQYSDLSISNRRMDNWYCLLRNLQDAEYFLKELYDGKIEHIIDSYEFLFDSLFCEYAYIINLDTTEFECYKGFQDEFDPSNKLIIEKPNETYDGQKYYPIKMIGKFPLDNIPDNWKVVYKKEDD